MNETSNKYLITAILVGIIFHSSVIFFTLEETYDALIHMFFANHYAQNWFEPWNYSWYTGFTVMGYPPLVHQAIGLLSLIGGLKFGLFSVAIIAVLLFITGAFRFAITLTGNRYVAGYTALIASLSSSFIETLHIFGQLPSIIGISILMHALPEIYLWIKTGEKKYLFTSLSLISVTVCSHHVTPIFGMVFFIFPLIGLVIMDSAREKVDSYKLISFPLFVQTFLKLLKRIIVFGLGSLLLIIICILPYWINSKKNPITQIPIPHGSRDNFLEVTSSGLMFFVIPWGVLLFLFPYFLYRYFSKRYLFFGLSLSMLFILGTGGTTPIPLKILGENAFNILTLDRFTLWASIMSLPIFGEFLYRFIETDLKKKLQDKFGSVYHRIIGGLFTFTFLFIAVFTISLGKFRPFQPQKINFLPIVNFLNQDQHDQWRYLPLGFGDQMASLSTLTKALTVDGNYHSARRLPELTSRAVERLENCKFRGMEGIGSLQQFLTTPEKYNLKYIFSNDKFYDPILYFCGWHRLVLLENGIMVWEKSGIAPLSTILPKEEVPVYQKIIWGAIPLLTVIIAFILNIQMIFYQALKIKLPSKPDFFKYGIEYNSFKNKLIVLQHFWTILMLVIISYSVYVFYIDNASQISPKNVIKSYYDALDFKEFERAHSYIDPKSNIKLPQYLLEISVSDGVLNSYGKLDAVETEIINEGKRKKILKAKTKWITPLETIEKTYIHEVVKRKNKWYIIPQKLDLDIPPDQFVKNNKNIFFKHGRRKITTQQTYHEDVLKQPTLEILNATLIKKNDNYIIIGEVQNIENTPADVVVKSNLYDKYNTKIASHNAKYTIKHKLMPMETSFFKIQFEDIAWSKNNEIKPSTFNPNEFTPLSLKTFPTSFDVHAEGNVATTDLYKSVSISDLEINSNKISGTLFNFGTEEVTIPQLLISFYNEKKQLIYIDHYFLPEGIRIQRKQYFSYSFPDLTDCKIISSGTENCYVNGISNKSIAEGIVRNRKKHHQDEQLEAVSGKGFSYIKIELNNFIGNPK